MPKTVKDWTRLAAALVLSAVAAVVLIKSFHRHQSWVDATAFICGSQAVRDHQSPYLLQPLAACEQMRFTQIHHPEFGMVVTPSPLPFYAAVPFMPLTYLPERAALAVWYALLIASVAISCVLLKRMTGYSLPLIFLAIFVPCVFISFVLGQIVPLIVCATIATAWFHREGKHIPAVLCALVTMLEPHLGAPLCAALFLIDRRSRIPLLCGAAALGAISLSLGSLAENLDYFREILPFHAATEVRNDEQLSLTHFAWLFGASERTALVLGSISYLISAVTGCVAAVLLSRDLRLRDTALFAAPSFALIGGTYSHVAQFSVFLVFALVLSSRTGSDQSTGHALSPRFAALLAVALFDMPLIMPNPQIDVYLYTGLALLLAHFLLRFKLPAAIATAAGAGFITLLIVKVRRSHDFGPQYVAAFRTHMADVTAHARLADDVWLANMHALPYQILGKLVVLIDAPIFFAIGLTLYALISTYRTERRMPTTPTEA